MDKTEPAGLVLGCVLPTCFGYRQDDAEDDALSSPRKAPQKLMTELDYRPILCACARGQRRVPRPHMQPDRIEPSPRPRWNN